MGKKGEVRRKFREDTFDRDGGNYVVFSPNYKSDAFLMSNILIFD